MAEEAGAAEVGVGALAGAVAGEVLAASAVARSGVEVQAVVGSGVLEVVGKIRFSASREIAHFDGSETH